MERSKYLVKNTTIIGLGSILTKLTQFIVLSLCTRSMSTGEYGIADICVSTAALLFPIFSLDIAESVFRFTMDKLGNDKAIISISTIIIICGGGVAFLITPIMKLIPQVGGYWIAIASLSLFESIQILCKEYTRGKEAGTIYVIGGVINSIVQIVACIILVSMASLGVAGYIISLSLGYISEFVYIFLAMKMNKLISFSSFDKREANKLLVYSLPLIPNTIMWWIVAISDRYFVLYMVGDSAAGLYSVAAKVPALITVATGIFFKAWQMSAIEAEGEKSKHEYTTRVFEALWVTGAISISIVLLILQPILLVLVAEEYRGAWIYSTVLIVSAGFASLQSFIGTSYTVQKDSIGCLKSTTFMAGINLILNFFLIKVLGIQGATYATLASYIFVTVYRYFDTRKYIQIKVDTVRIIVTFILLIIAAAIPQISPKLYYPFTWLSFISILIINFGVIKRSVIKLERFKR